MTGALDEMKGKAVAYYCYLNQGEQWKPKDRPWLPIADMDASWRGNAARWMKRRAAAFELYYSIGELAALSEPTMRAVVGEVDGVPVEDGPLFSHLDLMGDCATDAFDREVSGRSTNPAGWIRTTPLYRALVSGLPGDAS